MALTQTPKRSKKPKIFVDSSVLMAAAISPTGNARELINQGFTQELELYISSDVLEETERNLKLKVPKALGKFYDFRESLLAKSVKPTQIQVLEAAKQIEPKDAPIIAGAIQAKADFLATYDRKHLLQQKEKIKSIFHLLVVTPDEVVK